MRTTPLLVQVKTPCLSRVAVPRPRLARAHDPGALHGPQVRVMDHAAGTLWPDDPLRTAHARLVLRLLAGCGLRVDELAGTARRQLTPRTPRQR